MVRAEMFVFPSKIVKLAPFCSQAIYVNQKLIGGQLRAFISRRFTFYQETKLPPSGGALGRTLDPGFSIAHFFRDGVWEILWQFWR